MHHPMKSARPTTFVLLLTAAFYNVSAETVSAAEPGEPGQSGQGKGNPFPRPPIRPEPAPSAATSRYCVTPLDGWCDLAGADVGSPCECADENGKLFSGNAR